MPTIPKLKKKATSFEIIDHIVTGARASTYRSSMGVTAAATAEIMGVTAAHVSLLESGDRSWNQELLSRYISAVDQSKTNKTQNGN